MNDSDIGMKPHVHGESIMPHQPVGIDLDPNFILDFISHLSLLDPLKMPIETSFLSIFPEILKI